MFQNNAEARAEGGLVGIGMLLKADDGKLTVGQAMSPGVLENGRHVEQLPKAEKEIFHAPDGPFARNVSYTPDFPRAAGLLDAFWRRSGRAPIDGVMSVDPISLSYLLDYTGPVELDRGPDLTSDNVVDFLLHDSYELYDQDTQDEVFEDAAGSIFDALLTAQGPVDELVTGLGRGIEERRISLWSSHPELQELIAGETIAGELPQDTGRPSSASTSTTTPPTSSATTCDRR